MRTKGSMVRRRRTARVGIANEEIVYGSEDELGITNQVVKVGLAQVGHDNHPAKVANSAMGRRRFIVGHVIRETIEVDRRLAVCGWCPAASSVEFRRTLIAIGT